VAASGVAVMVDGGVGEVSGLVLQHRKKDRGSRHGSSLKRGHGGGVTPMTGWGPVVPRATPGYGGAL
jgi:hypothetical protein